MYVIGTAGHVDHGKSTLVEALSGIHPDRLAEEQEREMTIDLGFAWLNLGEGDLAEVGIVDVPGHRDFIENMLAGIGGIDLALFVVAADEGVMPQTREHLAILDLLGIHGGVVALTKTDLVDEEDWLELVILDLQETLAGTVLEEAPIIPVSAIGGTGLEQLQATLAARLQATEPQPDQARPRLPIDRVFSLSGFGTIVTGTLTGGRLQVGDTIEIQPAGYEGRIRGLQTHKVKRDSASPGSRVAVNISGLDKEQIQRGDVLAAPGVLRGTVLLDAAYRHLPDAGAPLKHNVQVKLFVGAAEVMARTRVLGARMIQPGESGWLQLALEAPVAAVRGDRFILRLPSPPATLGGGRILDPHPGRRHRRFRPEVVERLKTLAEGTPADILYQHLQRLQPISYEELCAKSGLPSSQADVAWQTLLEQDRVLLLGQKALTRAYRHQLETRLFEAVSAYHETYPLRSGVPREELRSRLGLTTPVFNALLAETEEVVQQGPVVRLSEHEIRFTPAEEKTVDRLLAQFRQAGINAPSVKESRAVVGDEIYGALLELGLLRQLNEDVVYRAEEYEQFISKIVDHLRQHGTTDVAQVRDLLNTSRKYAIALLEHLDDIRVTRRRGDLRELVPDKN